MKLKCIDGKFSIAKLINFSDINLEKDFIFIAKTDEENSIIAKTEDMPDDYISREDNFIMFRIEGELDFSLVGILAKISNILAKEKISIIANSTYNTDYVLLRESDFEKAKKALESEVYVFIN